VTNQVWTATLIDLECVTVFAGPFWHFITLLWDASAARIVRASGTPHEVLINFGRLNFSLTEVASESIYSVAHQVWAATLVDLECVTVVAGPSWYLVFCLRCHTEYHHLTKIEPFIFGNPTVLVGISNN